MKRLAVLAVLALGAAVASTWPLRGADQLGPVSFPRETQPDCRAGRAKLFDECGDQFAVLAAAQAEAGATGKVLLVSYGAEWCIWCHVLHGYLAGTAGSHFYAFEHTDGPFRGTLFERGAPEAEQQAADLTSYATETFVIAHIDDRYAPNGFAVLEALGADAAYRGALPFTFVVVDGRFVAALPDTSQLPEIEIRREGNDWYRGYDRAVLMQELRKLETAARAAAGGQG